MKKRIFGMLLILFMLLSINTPSVYATEPEETEAPTEASTEPAAAENACGDGITWSFEDGVLTISGDGAMADFEDGAAPWQAHMETIEEVILEGKLTYIGAYAFKDCDSLLAVDFGNALYEIGKEAFRSCDGLTSIWLPESFKVFGEASFQSCKNLEEIHCSGRFPSFRQNSMWDTYVTIFYPAERPWGVQYIQQLEEAFKGRVEFLASDGTDHYDPTEAPEETETPVTESQVPETTQPQTEPPAETDPPVQTSPAQTEPQQPEPTETAVQTQPLDSDATEATEPELPEQQTKDGMSVVLIAAGAVAAGLLAGYLIFGRKKGRYAK